MITDNCLISVLLLLRVNRAALNAPSVGDIAKVVVGVKKYGWNVHHDDWNGWVVSEIVFLETIHTGWQHYCKQ